MNTPTLFNPPPAPARFHRGPGMREETIHPKTFLRTMRNVLVRIAQSRPGGEGNIIGYVSIDDAREYADLHEIVPDSPALWGHLFDEGPNPNIYFKNTGAYKKSRYPSNKGRRVPDWAVVRRAA
ncbi:MAG: hypothetical protein ACF8NJ_00835 [Phycisphaerales bacterium JB038]